MGQGIRRERMSECKAKMTVEELIQFYEDSQAEKGDDIRIVIGQRGWVWVGRFTQDGDEVTIHDAYTIRKWGTTKGLGELVHGPKDKTVLDPSGTVRLHALAVLATMDCNTDKWGSVL
jgi:hypothetical protein